MYEYELMPVDGRKSFYGKCRVQREDDGREYLVSYHTTVARRDADGTIHRTWNGWSMTTGRHIRAFCGMSKAEYQSLPYEPYKAL